MKKSLSFLFPSLSYSTGNENLCVFYVLDRGEKARKEEFIKVALPFVAYACSMVYSRCEKKRKKRRTEKCQSYDSEHMMVEKEGRVMDIWTNILVVVLVIVVELCHFGRCV
jgi:hypothetical protein